MNGLYISEIKPLSVASFANIFSYSVGCLFILFIVSFAVQKFVSFGGFLAALHGCGISVP